MRLIRDDALVALPTLETGSVDAVVTDPPAGIAFMGKEWDSFGGKPPARSGYESYDRNGFMQDGRGLTIAQSARAKGEFIDFLSAVAAECLRITKPGGYALVWAIPRTSHWTATALENGGWQIRDRISHLFGTGFPKGKGCLKPACEDWWLCRKPGPRVLPLGIEECRIGVSREVPASLSRCKAPNGIYGDYGGGAEKELNPNVGRYPANVVHDGSDEVLEAFAAFGERKGNWTNDDAAPSVGNTFYNERSRTGQHYSDTGTAARFFYTAKASKAERGGGNTHPTVKPLALMEWLVKLVSRQGETVLDPFLGSGTTALACAKTGRDCVGIEKDASYFAIAQRRLAEVQAEHPLFAEAAS